MTRFREKTRQRHANQQFANPRQGGFPQDTAEYTIKLETAGDKKLADAMFNQDGGNLFKYVGQKFGVFFDLNPAEGTLRFTGSAEAASRMKSGFAKLAAMAGEGQPVDKNAISIVASQVSAGGGAGKSFKAANQNGPARHEGGSNAAEFKALNPAQEDLAKKIDENDLVFALGPAGTGKTHVAVVKGIAALKEALAAGKTFKLLLARPAAEAGEKLGFLPGDANAKLAPYMRPIYDELDKAFGPGKYKDMIEQGTIEIVPIGFMRGRTFDDAFIIVDEAQNLTIEQAKMAITRIGKGSKMVMTGDPQQIDLRDKNDSGLVWASEIMEGKPLSAKQVFEQGDVVRSGIVMTFVSAVDEWEISTGRQIPKAPRPSPQGRGRNLDHVGQVQTREQFGQRRVGRFVPRPRQLVARQSRHYGGTGKGSRSGSVVHRSQCRAEGTRGDG